MAETQNSSEPPMAALPEIQRPRRSPRRAVSIRVWLRREGHSHTWEEETETRVLSRYGAGLSCRRSVEAGAALVIVRRDDGQRANARVSYCRYDAEGRREIGIEFLNCDNFWGGDWNLAEPVGPQPESLRKPSGPAQSELVPGDQPLRRRGRAGRRTQLMADILIANEKQLWDAMKLKDMSILENLMALDFFWISSEGVQTKLPDLHHLPDIGLTSCSLNNFKVTKLNKTAAIVTSQGVESGSDDSQPLAPSNTCQTSVWVKRGGRWQVVFHQQTRTR